MAKSRGTVIMTGAGGGLGSEMAAQLTTRYPDCHKIYTVRDSRSPSSSLQAAVSSQSSYELVSLDVARLSSVREVARAISKRVASNEIPPIRALILNAGVLELEKQTWTSGEDGSFDTSFAVNYLGHWLLTMMLLGSMDRDMGRIVVIGSFIHDSSVPGRVQRRYYPEEHWRTFIHESTDGIAYGKWSSQADDPSLASGFRRYGAAKFCLLSMMVELQRRLARDPTLKGVTTIGIDPGMLATDIVRRDTWFVRSGLQKIIIGAMAWVASFVNPNGPMRTIGKGATDVLDAAMHPKWQTGGIYLDGARLGQVNQEVNNVQKRGIVWSDTVRYTALDGSQTRLADWN